MEIPVEKIESFIDQSVTQNASWQRIRLLGGEPTLHRDFFTIIERLRAYRKAHRPDLRIFVCTNGTGKTVQRWLRQLPADIEIKNTYKVTGQRLFRPFNMAPADSLLFRFSDFSYGCRILTECGIGLTPMGYYACAIAGPMDRIFMHEIGRNRLPDPSEDLTDHLRIFCRYCGHFGFQWPTKKAKMSPDWKQAYRYCDGKQPL